MSIPNRCPAETTEAASVAAASRTAPRRHPCGRKGRADGGPCENPCVRSRIQTGGLQSDTTEFRDEVRRIFDEADCHEERALTDAVGALPNVELVARFDDPRDVYRHARVVLVHLGQEAIRRQPAALGVGVNEIGRASCRERV